MMRDKFTPNAVLLLQNRDGAQKAFLGNFFGAPLDFPQIYQNELGFGEVVFNTSMTGYQEIMTDPSYFGQMVCMTYPHIGNTGINLEDVESRRPWISGLIVHEYTEEPSNWRSNETLQSYLKRNDIPAIYNLDTRALTRYLRSHGVVRGILSPIDKQEEARKLLETLPGFEGRDLVEKVSTPEAYFWPNKHPSVTQKTRIIAIDFGIKFNMLRHLTDRGCEVEVVPASTSAEDILAKNPDGVFLSNGPGDPSAVTYGIETVKNLLGNVPIFGVCMGHQILCSALGAKTFKLKFGHRGANHPVYNQEKQKVEITSQNHGYAVERNSLPAGIEVTHINLNDRTIEGIRCTPSQASSVQHHPEASPGPHDSVGLFDDFIASLHNRSPSFTRRTSEDQVIL